MLQWSQERLALLLWSLRVWNARIKAASVYPLSVDAVTAVVLYTIVSAKLWPCPQPKLYLLMGCNSFLINWTQSIFNSFTQSYWNCFHLQSVFCFSGSTIVFWAKIAVVKHIAVPMINVQGKPQEKLTYKWGSGLRTDLLLLSQTLHSFLQEEHHSF